MPITPILRSTFIVEPTSLILKRKNGKQSLQTESHILQYYISKRLLSQEFLGHVEGGTTAITHSQNHGSTTTHDVTTGIEVAH